MIFVRGGRDFPFTHFPSLRGAQEPIEQEVRAHCARAYFFSRAGNAQVTPSTLRAHDVSPVRDASLRAPRAHDAQLQITLLQTQR